MAAAVRVLSAAGRGALPAVPAGVADASSVDALAVGLALLGAEFDLAAGARPAVVAAAEVLAADAACACPVLAAVDPAAGCLVGGEGKYD